MQYAIIDIGSNSVRYLLYDPNRLGEKQLSTTRIGEGLSSTNSTLLPHAMERTVYAVAEFAEMGRTAGAQVHCYATSAVRDAPNKQEFLDLVEAACGFQVDVLSGEQEAEIAYLGAAGGDGAILDIGGGSTEIVYMQKKRLITNSLRMGCVRLLAIDDCTGIVNGEKLLQAASALFPSFSPLPSRWTGVGGTVTSLAAILLGLDTYDPQAVHGYGVARDALEALYDRLCSLNYEQRKHQRDIPPHRIDTIVTGAAILLAFMRKYSIRQIFASERDGMEGYALKYLAQ
ncbi:hypothetical protein LJB83_01665 [Clostridia bacterium OttesenSCG-928-F22]|nr:hypothetical protein [Clostridia bacterium OttesenSCG-928-F22]